MVVVGGGILVALEGNLQNRFPFAYAIAVGTVVVLLTVLGVMTTRYSRAMRALAAAHPGDVVLLARRLPPVVSDLPSFLKAKGLDVTIGDNWYPTTAHARGITIWTLEATPRPMLTMEWDEIGDVLAVRTATVGGDTRLRVTVDVKPYAVPLTADAGYAWGIVTAAMDVADTADLVAAVVAQRPTTTANA